MTADKLFLAGFSLVAVVVWVLSIARGWAGQVYDRVGPNAIQWYWLRRFGVSRSRSTCVRFANAASFLGITLVILFTVIVLVFAKPR